jgi:hypothetical protein
MELTQTELRAKAQKGGIFEGHRSALYLKLDGGLAMDGLLHDADDGLFAFAGLWDSWSSPDGKVIETCSIITTTPNSLCADVHDRMPVILPEANYDLWLDPGFQKADAVCDLLRPFDPNLMRRYEVSTRVNIVQNDDPACAEAVVRAKGWCITHQRMCCCRLDNARVSLRPNRGIHVKLAFAAGATISCEVSSAYGTFCVLQKSCVALL